MEPVVEVNDLRKVYAGVAVVDGVSLSVGRGEVFGVLGPNGAGKTTTVECVAGLRRPDGGRVRVLGLDPARDPAAVRARVGVQLQQAALPDRMRVGEAMAVFAAAYGRRDSIFF
jgi:ABC-2 type transport system ATP-binding protein